MPTDKDILITWTALSRKVLASILIDDGAIFPVYEIIGAKVQWFAPKEQSIYAGVLQCLSSNIPPTIESVTVKGKNIAPAYLATIAESFDEVDNRKLIYNTEQLKVIGILAEVRNFGHTLADIDTIDDIDKIVDKVTTELGGILAGASNRKNDSQSISDEAWSTFEDSSNVSNVKTGLHWFDDHTGGLWPGMNYQIVAAYKQGKSTLMRNCVLYAASLNSPVGIFCAEGTRELFALDCQAMLATQILIGDKDVLSGRLSGLNIKRYYHQQGVFSKSEMTAINDARKMWNDFPVFIWDTTDGIRSLSTLRYLVKRGRVHHGCASFWADYSQLFGEGKTLFERQSLTALTVQEIAQTENIAFCMLNQKNEEGVKGGRGGYSPNVKGGGDAAATADFLLIPQIDPDIPNVLNLELKLSRHTATAEGSHTLAISSGLILGTFY